ncbi:26S Proteasome non-ATPase regulatory subunit 9, putative [Eimeria tenella]|uniref:26S Proteasome non-ATPase regulatory subunit 9, putative n=1 Tax=Eimeria tenella TaxID=5802 RepID=U6L038_EIMTE|nr:26S Proteasome non-ATPase regulatory subunit 9, putative [Eimeria tenella]CDJ42543.1 26S Proteasome non-ATPase regulatory subunit 9, putative [Eimeria tenella]|eukprot:XP_013233293.1 26S Proteasome non-ATPase regulatory subunit 9, putative [Eimeria tenella]
MAASAGASSLAAQAEAVYRERQQIEEKMEALASFLTAEGMPGLKGPLVDPEGFPRADIDVHAVLQARQQLACLKTDHREVQQRLEETLLLLHAANAKDKPPAAALQRSSIPSSEAPPQQREGPPQQQEASPQLLQGAHTEAAAS